MVPFFPSLLDHKLNERRINVELFYELNGQYHILVGKERRPVEKTTLLINTSFKTSLLLAAAPILNLKGDNFKLFKAYNWLKGAAFDGKPILH